MGRAILSRLYLNRICSIVRTSCVSNSLLRQCLHYSEDEVCAPSARARIHSNLSFLLTRGRRRGCWWPSCSVNNSHLQWRQMSDLTSNSPFFCLFSNDSSFFCKIAPIQMEKVKAGWATSRVIFLWYQFNVCASKKKWNKDTTTFLGWPLLPWPEPWNTTGRLL